ncbi:MAG TPA: hypothetical protein EYQ80_04790 [Candidatus Poseidoniales archaeon]|nr:hypothetical protein [Candidatus Poseidoniales archaeon]
MDLEALLALTPEELAASILERRKVLQMALPQIEQRSVDEADRLEPLVEKLRLARDTGSNKVADLKQRRNASQAEARALLEETRTLRDKLEGEGGLKSLDPKWAREKLEESLQALEVKIDEQALSLKDERRLLAERKALLQKNEEWLEARRKDNPEMAQYIESSRKMHKLFRTADKLHLEMLEHVEKNEPKHAEFVENREGLRTAMRQVDRSRALIKQSESAITHWEMPTVTVHSRRVSPICWRRRRG